MVSRLFSGGAGYLYVMRENKYEKNNHFSFRDIISRRGGDPLDIPDAFPYRCANENKFLSIGQRNVKPLRCTMPETRKVFLLLTILVVLSLNSCTTKANVKSDPADLERYDRAVMVPDAELDCIYDSTRLRVGSMALLRTQSKSGLLSWRLSAYDNTTQKYILETSIIAGDGNGSVMTFEADSSGFRKLLMSSDQMKLINQTKLDPNQLEPKDRAALGNIFIATAAGGVIGGGISVILELISQNRSKVVFDRGLQAIKEHGHEAGVKIVKVTHVSNEEVIIGGQSVPCRVYQLDMITKGIGVSSGQSEPWFVVSNNSEKIWVSNDVPFGVVKKESKLVSIELVDFKY